MKNIKVVLSLLAVATLGATVLPSARRGHLEQENRCHLQSTCGNPGE